MSAVIIITPPPQSLLQAIDTALRELPPRMDSVEARVKLVTIAGQESDYRYRRQLIKRAGQWVQEGPAKSFWQGELGGGMCAGILRHTATSLMAKAVCERHGVPATARGIWDAIEHNDVLAAECARLLLWTDAAPLPPLGRVDLAWAYYLRNWRPGAYTRGTPAQRAALEAKWVRYYQAAIKAVRA